MTAGISQDTMLRINSRYYRSTNDGKVREWPQTQQQQTQQQQTQQSASNPVPVVQQNSGNRFDQVELNRLNKDYPELKGLITGNTAVNGNNIYEAETSFNNGSLVKHYFIFKDDKFVEVNADGSEKKDEKTYTPEELKKAIDKARLFNTYTVNGSNSSFDIDQLREDLIYSHDYAAVNSTLQNVNTDNVLAFLTEYYNVSGYKGGKTWGLLESVDCREGIPMSSKKNIIKSLLEAADALGMKENETYKEVANLYKLYDTGRYKNALNMVGTSGRGPSNSGQKPDGYWPLVWESTASFATVGATAGACFEGIGAIPGFVFGGLFGFAYGIFCNETKNTMEIGEYEPRDSAKLDRAMYKLVQEMNARLNQQCINRVTTPARRTMGVYEA